MCKEQKLFINKYVYTIKFLYFYIFKKKMTLLKDRKFKINEIFCCSNQVCIYSLKF